MAGPDAVAGRSERPSAATGPGVALAAASKPECQGSGVPGRVALVGGRCPVGGCAVGEKKERKQERKKERKQERNKERKKECNKERNKKSETRKGARAQ